MYAEHLQSILQGETAIGQQIFTQAPLKFATQTKHVSSINCLSHCLRSLMALAALLPCFQARGWWRLKATEWVAGGWSSAFDFEGFLSMVPALPSRSLTHYLLD